MRKRALKNIRRKAVLLTLVSGMVFGSTGIVSADSSEELKQQEREELIKTLSEKGQPGDINGDGVINVFDLMRYKNSLIEEKGFYSTGESAIDVNGDGLVDGVDITAVKSDILKQSKIWAYKSVPKMDGSTSAIPLEAGFKSKMLGVPYSDAKLLVEHHKTHESFSMLLSGENDMIFTVPISEDQQKMADEAGVKLNFVPVAKEGFVFVVNKNNPVDSLTSEQIRDIYSGKITNWKEVGGNDAKIIPYQRNKDSGSQNYMTEFMKGYDLMDPPKTLVLGMMSSLMDGIAVYDNAADAIGYSVYSYAAQMYENSSDTKFIAVDGVKPSRETMADGSYPLLSSTSIVYTDKASQNTKEFAEWAVSEEGQKTVLASGYVPVCDMEYPEEFIPYYAKGTGKAKPADYKPAEKFSRLAWSASWNNGMPDGEAQIFWLKNKELQKQINSDIHKTVFGDKACVIPGSWRMDVTIFNGIMNICFRKGGEYNYRTVKLEGVYNLNYDLKNGKKLENFSDLFYKDTDFVPAVSGRAADILAIECSDVIKTDYIGLMGKMDNFSFDNFIMEKDGPYFEYDLSVPFISYYDDMELIDSMITGEYFDCRELLEYNTENRYDVYIDEGTYPEWERQYKYDENGELRFDYTSRFHTAEEIKKRNAVMEQIYEKYAAEAKYPVGRNAVTIHTPEEIKSEFSLNVYELHLNVASIDKAHQYWYDPETLDRLQLSDIFGEDFEEYNESGVLMNVDYKKGYVKIFDKNSGRDLLISEMPETMNTKYFDKNTQEEISTIKQLKEKALEKTKVLYAKDYPEIGKLDENHVHVTVGEERLVFRKAVIDTDINAVTVFIFDTADFDNILTTYMFDPETLEPIEKSDVFGEKFKKYDGHDYSIAYINLDGGTVFLYDDDAKFYTEDIDFEKLNMKYIIPNKAEVMDRKWQKNAVVSAGNDDAVNSYKANYVTDYGPEEVYLQVSADTPVEITRICSSHGILWSECRDEDHYYGWIPSGNVRPDFNEEEYAFYEKHQFLFLDERPVELYAYGYNRDDIFVYSDEYISETSENPETEITDHITEYRRLIARTKCQSHGEWWYECWDADGRYYGWIRDKVLSHAYPSYSFNSKYIPITDMPASMELTLMGKSFGGAGCYNDSFIMEFDAEDPFKMIEEDIKVTATEFCYSHGEQWYKITDADSPDGYCWVNACYFVG
ncbi:MAG: substrate-binding domain-containing protein [Oscillospiraceae bacterium]|nr:substrate-binding domain-containing protein [Oscillospiraceae bacterium]